MTNLRLGIDMDGVIADFNAGWVWRYNRDFPGRDLTPDDVTVWDAPTVLTHFATMSEFWRWARTCAEGRSIFAGLDPYVGAVEALHGLAGAGHDIVILTTKPDFSHEDTHEWLDRYGVPTAEVHILDDKTAVECDVYLDDGNHNLVALVAAHPDALICRYVRPWNDPLPGATDVHDFAEFVNAVQTLG